MHYISDDGDGAFRIGARGERTTIVVDPTETAAVRRAVDDLARDLAAVCGAEVAVEPSSRLAGARVVVGTLGSPVIDDAVGRGELDLSALHGPDGAPLWEGYLLRTVGDRFWIVGADRRGTIFGIYDLCRAMGVSPWTWFADVPVRTRDHVSVRAGADHNDHPSVRYRGVFLNDEEELDAWARAHTSDGTLGPQTYARVFELILRLQGNYIWPAMHVNAFNADPENGRLAHEMGLVVGTSHCDMLLRSNQHEWEPWAAEHGTPELRYDYSIPGGNRESVREYWRGSVEQNAGYEVGWTVGMRGIHDSGFMTSAIDDDDSLSEPEKARARVRLLEQVITDQRDLLVEALGPDRGAGCLQSFVPYKEVLPLYDAGLRVPDDITIIWSDDNFGYIRRFPDERERTRPGGHGLYYHSSYWSPPPRSYLFISSTPLAHMRNELTKAWDRGIRTLWVDNIGALKPLEQDMEFFLRFAWEVGVDDATQRPTADVTTWTTQWIDGMFSGGHGSEVAAIYDAFAQVTNVRKIEHLAAGAFSQTAYGDESARRLARLRELYDATNTLWETLPEGERDAFFQLVGLKVHASYLVNAQFAYADRSTLAQAQGKAQAADHYLALSRAFDDHKRAMIRFYNTVMADGKWDHILTPEAFPPPTTALFPAASPALTIGAAGLGVVVWGDELPAAEPRLTFSPHGTPWKWFEVFTTGAGALDWTVTADPWIEVAATSGRVTTEERIAVRVLDPVAAAGRTGRIVVRSPFDGREIVVAVAVETAVDPIDGSCLLEADGYVSMSAADADEHRDGPTTRWVEVPRLGRGDGALLQVHGTGPAGTPADVAANASLGYRVHLRSAGAFLLELHRFPSLDSTGSIRLGVSVDGRPPVVLESPTTDEHRGIWEHAVVEEVERLFVRLPYLEPGEHVLRLHAVDEYVAVSHLVLHTAERRWSALPPPASARNDRPPRAVRDPAPHAVDLVGPATVRALVYEADAAPLPPHPVVYVGRHFWDRETTFTRNDVVPQAALGPARFVARADGTKDVRAVLGAGAVVERAGVLAVDVARSLLGTADGWRTPSLDLPTVTWTHTQAETDGGTGLALHVAERGRLWEDPFLAPGLHVRVEVRTGGSWAVWALVKFDSDDDDACVIALDGTPQPASEQLGGGDLFGFGLAQVWVWVLLSDLAIAPGEHTLSVLARRSGLRVDRLYLTLGDERPPADAAWPRT